ncbi:MAG: MMPL family transporter, partial [Sporichthyaceae bacterium]|nr:MMPL family transporter [Sporichthyaceae bacterium]
MFGSIGRFTYRRRRAVAFAWLVVLAAGLLIGPRVFSHLGSGSELRGDAESVVALRRLTRLTQSGSEVTALVDGRDVRDPAMRASVAAAVRDLRTLPAVRRVLDPLDPKAPVPALVAVDGRALLLVVELRDGLDGGEQDRAAVQIAARLERIEAPRVLVGGDKAAREEFQEHARRDLERGEAIALPFVVILLFLIFRGFVALSLPLAVAVVAVAGALLVLLGIAQATDISTYSVNVVTMLGLGLAVDYSLLIVSRFREERASGLDVPDAIERTLATAGRTVAFSGLTIAVALAGLLVFAESFLRSMAWGAIGVGMVAMAAAVTLIPALLGMWGRRIRPARAAQAADRGLFYRVSRLVQRFAVAIVPLLVAGLLLLALPFSHARLENSGYETLPPSSAVRQIFETLEKRFPGRGADPIIVGAEIDPRSPGARAFAERVEALPGVASVTPHRGVPPVVTVLDVTPQGSSEGEVATRLVRQIRALERPVAVEVTGSAALLVDYRDSLARRMPLALALIGLATTVLLFLMTRSVVVPLKAIAMNVLSLGASFGALVWIFQEGHLAGLLGFEPAGMVDITVPVLVFMFAFGLSMDYEVFLLSRIKEAWDETGDNDRAVALGLQRTGRIVTSAAALIVTVFLGFAAGELLAIKEIGIGMAIAILLDATVIRTLLVPATMKLMGRWNWWAPTPLRRLHDRLGLT